MKEAELTWEQLQLVREQAPLVHNITNYVVMNSTANALLALGASPVMAHAREEVAEMAAIARALVINIGTLSPHWVEAMEKAMAKAKSRGIPVVVDPVGAGATRYRTNSVKQLMQKNAPDIIRGNASEIGALYSAEVNTKGVDSTQESHSAREAARYLAGEYGCVVVVSGEVDYIISEQDEIAVYNGSALMARVTGMGCAASALTGAFAGVIEEPVEAAAGAMRVMGIAGEMAAERAEGPGTLQLHFIDALYNIDKIDIEQKLKSEVDYA
jgi:hydroxyethylthiazole kinase